MAEDRNRELLFAEKLEEIRKLAREQGQCVSMDQVEECFAPLGLHEDQMAMVYDYLKKHNVGIGEPADPTDYLEEEELNYLEMYLQDLAALPEYTEAQKEAYTLSAMAGDLNAQKTLMEIYLPAVVEIAKLYAGQGVVIEDLIGEGNVAVAMGVSMLGAMEHAAEAQGMLGKMVMDAMEDLIAETADLKQKDNKLADKINRVSEKADELARELGRKVTVEELVAEGQISRKAALDAIRISGNKIDNLTAEGEM